MISPSLISKLRRISDPVPQVIPEKCDFCGKIIPPDHRHLVDLTSLKFMCACELCSVVQAVVGVYKPLPQRFLRLNDFQLSDELWSDFMIPVNMAFFVFSSLRKGTVAYYPAPTGATESKLKLEAWEKLEQLNPVLKSLVPDLEGLLINRIDSSPLYYIVPIDSCYKLIGMIRNSWQGLFGGSGTKVTTRKFFDELSERSSCQI
ncbi:MAG: DUF5947 family protein [bacterium]